MPKRSPAAVLAIPPDRSPQCKRTPEAFWGAGVEADRGDSWMFQLGGGRGSRERESPALSDPARARP
eukprot:6072181-Pyramimonas_sp.AAC.1